MSILMFIAVELANLVLIAGTAYLVGWHGWSGWWFLLTICLLNSYKTTKSKLE